MGFCNSGMLAAQAESHAGNGLRCRGTLYSEDNSAGGGAWRDEYLRRAVRNCRRALLGEAPQNLIGPAERML